MNCKHFSSIGGTRRGPRPSKTCLGSKEIDGLKCIFWFRVFDSAKRRRGDHDARFAQVQMQSFRTLQLTCLALERAVGGGDTVQSDQHAVRGAYAYAKKVDWVPK